MNYERSDTDKFLKLQKIFQKRWAKDNLDANYRTNSDIFNTTANKSLKDGKFYKTEAKNLSEDRMENTLRVNNN
jgi:hypothetical protein